MKNWTIGLLVTVLACKGWAEPQGPDLQIRAAEIVGYGVFEADVRQRFVSRIRSNAVAADRVDNIKFVDFTNEIPGVLGTDFGIQFIINSSPRGGKMEVTYVIRFPDGGLRQPNGKVWTESREEQDITIGERNFYGYGFDEEWEIVAGEWQFEVWYRKARLIRKTFTVVLPEEAVVTKEEVIGE